MKVLFVDAHEANHFTIQTMMKKYKEFTVDMAATVENAFTQLDGNSHHMVVIDCSQPQIDGYNLAQKIRQRDKENHHFRVIIGLGDAPKSDDFKKWLVVGMNDYYQKPISVKAMADIFKRYKDQAMDDYI